MNKHWKRNQQNGFILSVDGQEIGEMNVNFSGLNKSATFNIRQDSSPFPPGDFGIQAW